jgi:stearoyl-CoA desaturase (delta-9 desaturase)
MDNQKFQRHLPPLNWDVISVFGLFHIGAAAALFMFSWQALITAIVLYWIAGSLGIGMGYHRLLTHRGYKTSKPVEYFLTVCGTLALESGPIHWVATHRIHHALSDREGDPHTPRDGAWWAHIGWLLVGRAQVQPEGVLQRYAPDLMRDPVHVWLNRHYALPVVFLGLGLFALGGWPFLTWGLFLRVVLGLHATWLVNSATHLWGSRRFATRDDSRNNWWVALLTFGEGWHNNHHAHPASARHGFAWYEVDLNWWGILMLKRLGLANSIRQVRLKDPLPPAAILADAPEGLFVDAPQ